MNRIVVLRKYTLPAVLLFCAGLVVLGISRVGSAEQVSAGTGRPAVLIDPGHGGMDGGSSGADGTRESDLNLAVSLPLRDMLALMGYEVSMTRESDVSIHDEGADTIREKKVSDMRNRLKLYNAAEAVISIHQNTFTQTKYWGTQIFYAPANPESQRLADCLRGRVISALQPDNKRELKRGSPDIFLMDGAKQPTALVECGFLSNPSDLEKIKDPEYRKVFALALAAGYVDWDAGSP